MSRSLFTLKEFKLVDVLVNGDDMKCYTIVSNRMNKNMM